MKPSQYHYIKRMWTRNTFRHSSSRDFGKGDGCCWSILSLFFIIALISPVFSFIKEYTHVIIAFIILAIFKMIHTHTKKLSPQKVIELMDILDNTQKLANIVNHTSDREEFEGALTELKRELQELSRYESYGIFQIEQPSQALKRIIEIEPEQRRLFLLRESEAASNSLLTSKRVQKIDSEPFVSSLNQKRSVIQNKQLEDLDILLDEDEESSTIDIDAYARMCNAYLEHQDEMAQYDN